VVKDFSAHFQTVIFDNRASGRSDIITGRCTIGQMANDAVKLLDFLKIKQAHTIGHSMGGYIAQEIAINYPERLNKLILVSTAAISSPRNNMLFADFLKQLQERVDLKAWMKQWAFWLFTPQCFSNTAFINAFIKNAAEYPYCAKPQGFKVQIEAIASFDACKRTGKIKAKTLVLEGEKDILIVPQEAKALAKNIPRSSFRLLKNTAHCIHIENPKLFAKVALEFIRLKK
jgi:pimeloyl-ACP methyl ester carboxylesterase